MSILQALLEPLEAAFFTNALWGGILAALICAVAGTWVVVRGMAFLGEAVSHGMLPGVAIAAVAGASPLLGAGVSALVMAMGIGWLTRRARLSQDTAIGIAFVIMLSLGVIIVSRSRNFATDLTTILFGDILAISTPELWILSGGLALTVALAFLLRRPLTALALDQNLAKTLGMRPRLAQVALTILVTIAVVASYRAIGSLLVVALLVAPAATASLWARSIPAVMAWAALLGSAAVVVGLYISWFAATAAGASISVVSGMTFLVCAALRPAFSRRRAVEPTHLADDALPAARTN
ncbi:zinc ABC transporter permease AztB [Buchananella felis]|uniref:zinc ABC transporter permease AztB n=1 Tax=Buchananella felis TaxID=3231492 RepID=UPI0035277148